MTSPAPGKIKISSNSSKLSLASRRNPKKPQTEDYSPRIEKRKEKLVSNGRQQAKLKTSDSNETDQEVVN